MASPSLPRSSSTTPFAELLPNLLLAAIPILRAEAAQRFLGLDPLSPVARLVAGHPWIGRLLAIPLDQATALSRSLTLCGTVLAILCGFALYRLARTLGLGRLAAAPALAYEFAPGLPALGFERAGLALLALPLLLQASLQAREVVRSPIPRIAAATALLAVVLRPDQTPAAAATAILFAGFVVVRAPRPTAPRTALRLVAGAALGLCLAFPFTALDLLAAAPSTLVSHFAPLIPARTFDAFDRAEGFPTRLAVLLPSLGLAAAGLVSARGRAPGLPAALGLALLLGLAALIRDGAQAASPTIPVAAGLLAALAIAARPDRPARIVASVLLFGAAVGAILFASGLPRHLLLPALALLLLPAAALALGRAAAGGTLVLATAAAWALAP